MSDGNQATASTVGQLLALLTQIPPETPIQFSSTDGPDYGWLDVGPEQGGYHVSRDGRIGSLRDALLQIGNPE